MGRLENGGDPLVHEGHVGDELLPAHSHFWPAGTPPCQVIFSRLGRSHPRLTGTQHAEYVALEISLDEDMGGARGDNFLVSIFYVAVDQTTYRDSDSAPALEMFVFLVIPEEMVDSFHFIPNDICPAKTSHKLSSETTSTFIFALFMFGVAENLC